MFSLKNNTVTQKKRYFTHSSENYCLDFFNNLMGKET